MFHNFAIPCIRYLLCMPKQFLLFMEQQQHKQQLESERNAKADTNEMNNEASNQNLAELREKTHH